MSWNTRKIWYCSLTNVGGKVHTYVHNLQMQRIPEIWVEKDNYDDIYSNYGNYHIKE